MAVLNFDSAASDQSTGISDTTLVCAAPSGASVDDRLLIAQCEYLEGAPGYGNNIIPPAGWNQLLVESPFDDGSAIGVGGGFFRHFTWLGWKITASEPANYTFLTPMNIPPFVYILGSAVDIVCYTGVDPVNPFDNYSTTWTRTNSTPDFTLPQVSTVNGIVPAITHTQQGGNFTYGVGSQLAFNNTSGGTSPVDVMWMEPGGATITVSNPIATYDYDQLGPGAPTYGRHFARPDELADIRELRVSFDFRYVV